VAAKKSINFQFARKKNICQLLYKLHETTVKPQNKQSREQKRSYYAAVFICSAREHKNKQSPSAAGA